MTPSLRLVARPKCKSLTKTAMGSLRTKLLVALGALILVSILTKDYDKQLCTPTKFARPDKLGGLDHENDLLMIATRTGTDKVTTHSYDMLYQKYLQPIRHRPLKLLEIGLGCDMGYSPGASQQVGWYVAPMYRIVLALSKSTYGH